MRKSSNVCKDCKLTDYSDFQNINVSYLPSIIYKALTKCTKKNIQIHVQTPVMNISPEFRNKYEFTRNSPPKKSNMSFTNQFLKSISTKQNISTIDDDFQLLQKSVHLSKIAMLHESRIKFRERLHEIIQTKDPNNEKEELSYIIDERNKLLKQNLDTTPYSVQCKERKKMRLMKIHQKHQSEWSRMNIDKIAQLRRKRNKIQSRSLLIS